MPVNQENIRSAIRELMFRDHIKQSEIADATGIHKGNISKMINGFASINQSVIAFFENRYDTKIEQLISQLSRKSAQPSQELSHKIEILEERVSGLERELKWANEAIKSKDLAIQSLQSQLDEQKKKREPYHDNPGNSGPTPAKQKVAGGKQ